MTTDSISAPLLEWFDHYGRKHLPWQQKPTPYSVWVSEIMLQQTQVTTVIPYYQRFMAAFPDVQTLAAAHIDQVLHLWTGLGYYARGRNLHRTAQVIVEQHGGKFPQDVEVLSLLPGIGRSTAGAILALGWRKRAVILDGNVKRVLTRLHCIEGWPDQPKVQKTLWELAERYTPHERCADYTQAIMDLGATLCARSKPACGLCPLHSQCQSFKTQRTAEFPGKKPSKRLPVKSTFLLMYLDSARHRVLLEKRPPTGIWGGMWSFPESSDLSAVAPEISTCLLPERHDVQPWATFRHTFSHFHLEITPVLIPLAADAVSVMESDRLHWYALHEPSTLGLAAPVKMLLERLTQQVLNS